MREDDSFARPASFARASNEKQSYRDAYISHGSEYLEDSPRRGSRVATRRISPLYDDERYGYMEHSSSYPDNRSRDYSSITRLKRPYSSMVSCILVFCFSLVIGGLFDCSRFRLKVPIFHYFHPYRGLIPLNYPRNQFPG